jgi:hypothetical protein
MGSDSSAVAAEMHVVITEGIIVTVRDYNPVSVVCRAYRMQAVRVAWRSIVFVGFHAQCNIGIFYLRVNRQL